ncbi:MAG: hypothetical protein WED04_03195 [Promethearchaeati archaeon SRVP18_Atabeyarchaeia-1]
MSPDYCLFPAMAWDLLSVFPEGELKRCDPKTIEAARKVNAYEYIEE